MLFFDRTDIAPTPPPRHWTELNQIRKRLFLSSHIDSYFSNSNSAGYLQRSRRSGIARNPTRNKQCSQPDRIPIEVKMV